MEYWIRWRQSAWQNVTEAQFFDATSQVGYSEYMFLIKRDGKEIYFKVI